MTPGEQVIKLHRYREDCYTLSINGTEINPLHSSYTLERAEKVKSVIQAALDAAVAHERERCARVAEDKANLRMIGGSTGNAWDTASAIAAAIRAGR